ncbi:MAG: Zn-ribbon domain-containing OB-fold protein [Bacillota bacterium]|nr:Zn-ribbon domain-containing OB-fold protein [Bacillota bacterium]
MAGLEKPSRRQDAPPLYGDQGVWHQYTYGIAGEKFFRGLIDQKLLAASCPECGRRYLPPRMYCAECFRRTEEWVEVKPPGVVQSFTVLHRDLEDAPLTEPQVVAFISFPGTCGGIIHLLREVPRDEICIGLLVEPVFAGERKGNWQDIRYFRPARSSR